MIGLSGEMIRPSGKHNVLIRIYHLEQALTLTISPHLLEVKHSL
jgi:hypothetical protein